MSDIIKREYCCPNCGLIWFSDTQIANEVTCPECGNSNKKDGLYACNTMGYAYAHEDIVKSLIKRDKKIHFAVGHPYFYKNEK